jgi:hypothetical protein
VAVAVAVAGWPVAGTRAIGGGRNCGLAISGAETGRHTGHGHPVGALPLTGVVLFDEV